MSKYKQTNVKLYFKNNYILGGERMAKYFPLTSNEISKRELDHMKIVRDLAGECMVLK